MDDEVFYLVKMHDYFRGVSEEAIADFSECAQVCHFDSGEYVHHANDPIESINFIVRGRVKAVYIDRQGVERLFRIAARGEQFGFVGAALEEPTPVSIVALEPATLVSLDYETALDLTSKHRDLRRRWSQAFAGRLREQFLTDIVERSLTIIVVSHESPATREITGQLTKRLLEIGETPSVLSDDPYWTTLKDVPDRPFIDNGELLDDAELRRQISQWDQCSRIIIDVDANLEADRMARLVRLSDRVLWCIEPGRRDSAVAHLRAVEEHAEGWREKISVVWRIEPGAVAPDAPDLRSLSSRDFKIYSGAVKPPMGQTRSNGIERLIHDLRGVQIGLALGGGAARGMAHLGVLETLEQQGIVIDMIAGTSAGAMTGALYAAGFDPEYLAEKFAGDLRPSLLFRSLPRGKYWNLIYKYRRGRFDPMLRKYLNAWKLEQLPIPSQAVTVDLVSGQAVVRDHGDSVDAILESINLPVLSKPITRNGQALVDGGLVNNIPANVLVSNGCNFVIAVSVTAKMEYEFCRNRPETATEQMRTPGTLQTLLRAFLVQSYNMNSIGVQPADVIIDPDVTGFDLTDFDRAPELAAVGRDSAEEHAPRLVQLLRRLDPALFAGLAE